MPQFQGSTSVAAGAVANLIAGWQYEFLPWPARIKLLWRTTAVGVNGTVFSGSETIQEESQIQSGGTAGVTPSDLNTPSVEFLAPAGDRLKFNARNTTGGALTVDFIVYAHPVG
jgi:hypothetical protein